MLTDAERKLLFTDINGSFIVTNQSRKENKKRMFTGSVRVNAGLYYTDREKERFIRKSLKKRLPF